MSLRTNNATVQPMLKVRSLGVGSSGKEMKAFAYKNSIINLAFRQISDTEVKRRVRQ